MRLTDRSSLTPLLGVLVVIVGLGSTACRGGAEPGSSADVAVAGEWVFVSGSTATGTLDPPTRDLATLTITADGMGGRGPCNDYGASQGYSVEGDRVHLRGIDQTLAGCDGAAGRFESAYLSALADVDRMTRDGDRLTLSGEQVRLEFGPMPAWPEEAVVGESWVLRAVTSDHGDDTPSPAASRTARRVDTAVLYLGRSGSVTASSGCRRLTGTWTEWHGGITMTEASWSGTCPRSLRTQDAAVSDVLREFTAAVRPGGGTAELVLTAAHSDRDGIRTQLVYRR